MHGTPEVRASIWMTCSSGLLFAGLFVTALLLLWQTPGMSGSDAAWRDFYGAGRGQDLVTVGLYLVPFAGIAFIWHMSATRTMLDAVPGKPAEVPRWLQTVAGIVFVCMLFSGCAAVAAVALESKFSSAPMPAVNDARALTAVGYSMVFVFGVRAAGMFMLATTTLFRSRGLLNRWQAALSYLTATFLLVSTTFHPSIVLVFPGWMVLLCLVLLGHQLRARPAPTPPE